MRAGALIVFLAMLLVQFSGLDHGHEDANRVVTTQVLAYELPEEFSLTYAYTYLNLNMEPVIEYTYEVSSNGSTAMRSIDYVDGIGSTEEKQAMLSEEWIQYLRDALEADDVCDLEGVYNDAGYDIPTHGYTNMTLGLSSSYGEKTIEFMGNAMIGIMPYTTIALGKLGSETFAPGRDMINITTSVTASIDSAGIIRVAATVWNNSTHTYMIGGACSDYWAVSIIRCNGCTVAEFPDRTIIPTCVIPINPGESYEFETETWNATGIATGRYVVMAMKEMLGMTMLEITEDLGHVNQAPNVLQLSVSEVDGSEGTYIFDVSRSCDREDISTDLQVRWDWYSDGVWDTDWSYDKTAQYTFEDLSGYELTVEIKDTEGAIASTSESMDESTGTTSSSSIIYSVIGAAVIIILIVALAVMLKKGWT